MIAPLEPSALRGLVDGLAGTPDLWTSRVRHDPSARVFERLWCDERLDVWLICWSGEDHASLRRLAALGDDVQVWPGHVGGSLCGGGNLRAATVSTIGEERASNRSLGIDDEDAFAAALLATLPVRPPGVAHIVARNRAPLPWPPAEAPALAPAEVAALLRDGAVLVDGRPASDFDAAHVPGSICLPADRAGVGTRAGWALAARPPVVTVAATPADARRLADLLRAVGIDDVRGILADGVEAWRAAGNPIAETSVIEVAELSRALGRGEVELLDVRDLHEWAATHVAAALHVPLSALSTASVGALDVRRPVVVACAGGTRSAVAASLVARMGHPDVRRVARGGVPDLAALL